MTRPAHAQAAYSRRLEWGLAGAHALVADARPGDVAVVVDVLSFTTTLTVAVEQGVVVHPYPWRAEDAAAYAERARGDPGRRPPRGPGDRLGEPVPGVVPRRRRHRPRRPAVAQRLRDLLRPRRRGRHGGRSLPAQRRCCVRGGCASGRHRPWSVVAAGERWPDGQLRPAVEDLWGAGAVLAALGADGASPEARMAAAAFRAVEDGLGDELRELRQRARAGRGRLRGRRGRGGGVRRQRGRAGALRRRVRGR